MYSMPSVCKDMDKAHGMLKISCCITTQTEIQEAMKWF